MDATTIQTAMVLVLLLIGFVAVVINAPDGN